MNDPTELEPGTPLLFARVLDGQGGGRAIDWAGIREWEPRPDGPVLWMHLCRNTPGVYEWLQDHAGIPEPTAELLTSDDTRPRAFREGNTLVATLRGINFNPGAQPEDMISMQVWSDGVRLLVSDSGNNRVLYWSLLPQTSGEEADYVIGQSDFGRSTSGTSASALRTPYGVTSDGTSVWIADSGNNRVLEFGSFPIANQTSANSVIGQDEDSFTSSTANDDDQDGDVDDEPSSRTLSGATGVYANNGTLYVTDRSNNRVLFFPQ